MSAIQRLLDIMARLRDPDDGCPWDLEQDFETISPFTIEEAYEVDEAIASGDPEAIRDELGDLLFQVVFQARIAQEKGLFDFDGVAVAISEKLVRRHPHVFAGAETPSSLEAQTASWEAIKEAERAAAGKGEGSPDPFEGIPRHLPALARSAKIAGRIDRAGGGSAASPEANLETLIAETARALAAGDASTDVARALAGQGLQAWVRLARAAGVDPEKALRDADDQAMRALRERE